MSDADKLAVIIDAIRTINRLHNLGDAIYDVREQVRETPVNGQPFEGSSWDHPLVKEYSDAVAVLHHGGVIS